MPRPDYDLLCVLVLPPGILPTPLKYILFACIYCPGITVKYKLVISSARHIRKVEFPPLYVFIRCCCRSLKGQNSRGPSVWDPWPPCSLSPGRETNPLIPWSHALWHNRSSTPLPPPFTPSTNWVIGSVVGKLSLLLSDCSHLTRAHSWTWQHTYCPPATGKLSAIKTRQRVRERQRWSSWGDGGSCKHLSEK